MTENSDDKVLKIIPYIYFFVKKGIKRMDDPSPEALRQLILKAVNECSDPDTLDLVFKLLTYNA